MAFKSRDLLDQLADLQLTLEGYSLQQLSVEEAKVLKKSFEEFRIQLESRLWSPDNRHGLNSPNKVSIDPGEAEALRIVQKRLDPRKERSRLAHPCRRRPDLALQLLELGLVVSGLGLGQGAGDLRRWVGKARGRGSCTLRDFVNGLDELPDAAA